MAWCSVKTQGHLYLYPAVRLLNFISAASGPHISIRFSVHISQVYESDGMQSGFHLMQVLRFSRRWCGRIPTFRGPTLSLSSGCSEVKMEEDGPPKLWYPTTTVHGVATQNTWTWNFHLFSQNGVHSLCFSLRISLLPSLRSEKIFAASLRHLFEPKCLHLGIIIAHFVVGTLPFASHACAVMPTGFHSLDKYWLRIPHLSDHP